MEGCVTGGQHDTGASLQVSIQGLYRAHTGVRSTAQRPKSALSPDETVLHKRCRPRWARMLVPRSRPPHKRFQQRNGGSVASASNVAFAGEYVNTAM